MATARKSVQVCSSVQLKPATTAGFSFLSKFSAMRVPQKYIDYRPPRIVKGKRWYVEYWYRVPAELLPEYNGKTWERFRVIEHMNRYEGQARDEYAELLLSAVGIYLEGGYSPFEDRQQRFHIETGEGPKKLTIKEGLEYFLEKYAKRGLSSRSMYMYKTACEQVRAFFVSRNLLHQPMELVKRGHIETLLEELKENGKWGNRQYNNARSFIYTVFEFLRKKEIISKNPVEGVDTLKTTTTKHKYYDKTLFPKITTIIKENEPYLWQACQFVYYLAVRSEKELSGIKVKDIMDNGERFLFRKEISKSKRDDVIPVDPHLKKVFKEMGLLKADPEYYIFTIDGRPGPKPFGKGFFSKKFAKIRKMAGLSDDYSVYGFKHSRAVHLVRAGVNLSDIMKLFRHTNLIATMSYLRGIGIDFDPKDMQKKTKKI